MLDNERKCVDVQGPALAAVAVAVLGTGQHNTAVADMLRSLSHWMVCMLLWWADALYITVDKLYGNMEDGFVVAQSWMNLVEIFLGFVAGRSSPSLHGGS